MGIGISIILIAIGAILAFAVHYTLAGIDLQTIGLILAGVGVLGLIMALIMTGMSTGGGGMRRRQSVEESYTDPADPNGRVVRRNDTIVR